MSLSHFVERPAIREAFKEFAAPTKVLRSSLPFDIRDVSVLVESSGEHQSFVGTAFDYMARFRIARDILQGMPDADLTVSDSGWIAEQSLELMLHHPHYHQYHARWETLITRARDLFTDFISGKVDDMSRIATCCQFLANIDHLYRIGEFKPIFKIRDNVQRELLDLNRVFEPLVMFDPKKSCALNPRFHSASIVHGADADLMVDGTIIDFKTVSDFTIAVSHLRQLAGYAVLHGHGGIDIGDDHQYPHECTRLALYFSRHARLVSWDIREVFPGRGLEHFTAAFIEEAKIMGSELESGSTLNP